MDRKRIEEEWHDFYKNHTTKTTAISFAKHIAAIARNEALEEAAKHIQPSNHDYPDDFTEYAKIKAECANDIRALKS